LAVDYLAVDYLAVDYLAVNRCGKVDTTEVCASSVICLLSGVTPRLGVFRQRSEVAWQVSWQYVAIPWAFCQKESRVGLVALMGTIYHLRLK
jgi:hypothetical protein